MFYLWVNSTLNLLLNVQREIRLFTNGLFLCLFLFLIILWGKILMGGRSNVTATFQYIPKIVHSHQYLNERMITTSTLALQDSRRITITVKTLT